MRLVKSSGIKSWQVDREKLMVSFRRMTPPLFIEQRLGGENDKIV